MNGADESPAKGAIPDERATVEQKKICPLLSLGLTSGVGKNRSLPCLSGDCAWWNTKAGCCTVVAGREA